MKRGKPPDEYECVCDKLQQMRSNRPVYIECVKCHSDVLERIENFLLLASEQEQREFIQYIIEQYENDDFQAPPSVVDQFFTYVSDMSSNSEIREMIFSVFILVIQSDTRGEWRKLINPREMILVLNNYIPEPRAVSFLCKLLVDNLSNSSFFLKTFRSNNLPFVDFFIKIWNPKWEAQSASLLLDILRALASHPPLLPQLNRAKLHICDVLYEFSNEPLICAGWDTVALFAENRATRSDLFYTKIFDMESLDLTRNTQLQGSLIRFVRKLTLAEDCCDLFPRVPLPLLLNLGVTRCDEPRVRKICRLFAHACCLVGVDIVQWLLGINAVATLTRLRERVAHRTWSDVVILFSEMVLQANEEQIECLLLPSIELVEIICEYTTTLECEPPPKSQEFSVLRALRVVAEEIALRGLVLPEPSLACIENLAQGENDDFHPLADFLKAVTDSLLSRGPP